MPSIPAAETLQALHDLLTSRGIDPSGLYGPAPAPVLLPEHVRTWLGQRSPEELDRLLLLVREFDEDDIVKVKKAMKLAEDSATVGRFVKWLGISVITLFMGAVAFGEKIAVVWKWLMGAPR